MRRKGCIYIFTFHHAGGFDTLWLLHSMTQYIGYVIFTDLIFATVCFYIWTKLDDVVCDKKYEKGASHIVVSKRASNKCR